MEAVTATKKTKNNEKDLKAESLNARFEIFLY